MTAGIYRVTGRKQTKTCAMIDCKSNRAKKNSLAQKSPVGSVMERFTAAMEISNPDDLVRCYILLNRMCKWNTVEVNE